MYFQNLNMKSNEWNEPPKAARACVLDLDREILVTEVEEVLLKVTMNNLSYLRIQ